MALPIARSLTVGLLKSGLLSLLSLWLSACVTTMDKAAKPIDPNRALATHVQLALGYLGESNLDSARFHVLKAEVISARDPSVLNVKALVHQLEGEPELAEKAYRKALSVDKRFTQARLNYATFLFSRQRFEDAYQQYELASDDLNYERRATTLYGVGISALKLGREERAVAAFKQAVLLQPSMATAHLELADYYFRQQNYAEAKKYLNQYDRNSKASARSLWLGIRIDRVFGNQDKEASQVLSLKNLFPYSQEYLEYKQGQGSR